MDFYNSYLGDKTLQQVGISEGATPEAQYSDPTLEMKNYCWCDFDYASYGLSKIQVNQLSKVMILSNSRRIDFVGDASLSKNSLYVKLLEGYKYQHVEGTKGFRGKVSSIYVCKYDNCGMEFTRAWNMLNHARIHEGSKPYQCQICEKTFIQKGNLKKHIKIHLYPEVENRKRFRWSICDSLYTEKYNYKVRQDCRIHSLHSKYSQQCIAMLDTLLISCCKLYLKIELTSWVKLGPTARSLECDIKVSVPLCL